MRPPRRTESSSTSDRRLDRAARRDRRKPPGIRGRASSRRRPASTSCSSSAPAHSRPRAPAALQPRRAGAVAFAFFSTAAGTRPALHGRPSRRADYKASVVFLIPATLLLRPELLVPLRGGPVPPGLGEDAQDRQGPAFNIANAILDILAAWASSMLLDRRGRCRTRPAVRDRRARRLRGLRRSSTTFCSRSIIRFTSRQVAAATRGSSRPRATSHDRSSSPGGLGVAWPSGVHDAWAVAVRRRAARAHPPRPRVPAASGRGPRRREDGPLQRTALREHALGGARAGAALRPAAVAAHGRPRPAARDQQHLRPSRRRRRAAGHRRHLPRGAAPLRRRRAGSAARSSRSSSRRRRPEQPSRSRSGSAASVAAQQASRRETVDRPDPRHDLDRRRDVPAGRHGREGACPRRPTSPSTRQVRRAATASSPQIPSTPTCLPRPRTRRERPCARRPPAKRRDARLRRPRRHESRAAVANRRAIAAAPPSSPQSGEEPHSPPPARRSAASSPSSASSASARGVAGLVFGTGSDYLGCSSPWSRSSPAGRRSRSSSPTSKARISVSAVGVARRRRDLRLPRGAAARARGRNRRLERAADVAPQLRLQRRDADARLARRGRRVLAQVAKRPGTRAGSPRPALGLRRRRSSTSASTWPSSASRRRSPRQENPLAASSRSASRGSCRTTSSTASSAA